jgi:hypothetical protein
MSQTVRARSRFEVVGVSSSSPASRFRCRSASRRLTKKSETPCLDGTFPVAIEAQMIGLLVSGSSERSFPLAPREVGKLALVEERAHDVPLRGVDPDQHHLLRGLLARPRAAPGSHGEDGSEEQGGEEAGGGEGGVTRGEESSHGISLGVFAVCRAPGLVGHES